MKLSEFCVMNVACCTRQTTVLEAARMMRRHHTGDLIVVDDPEGERVPAGIITDRDIVVDVLGMDLDPATTAVGDVMVKYSHLVVAREDEDMTVAVERMRAHGVRRLPVVNHADELVGVVTLDDLLRMHALQAQALADIVAKEQTQEQRQRR